MEKRLTFVLLIFSNLMTIAQVYEILERQERLSIRLNFFLLSVCYIEWVRCLLISIKKLFSTDRKSITFIRGLVCTTFKLALFEQITKLKNTLKNG